MWLYPISAEFDARVVTQAERQHSTSRLPRKKGYSAILRQHPLFIRFFRRDESMSVADETVSFNSHPPTPIESLPDELLREIFEHAADVAASEFQLNSHLLPALLTTCSVWRANAFATPRLWSFVNLTYMNFIGSQGEELVSCNIYTILTHLQYSQLHTFDLCVAIRVELHTIQFIPPNWRADLQRVLDTLTQLLSPHAHRCASLTIVEEGPHRLPMFMPPPSMNNLRRLKLRTHCGRSAEQLFPSRLYVRTPQSRDEQCDTPLFVQRDYTLDSLDILDVDIVRCSPGTTVEGLEILTFNYASELRGLRCLKFSAELYYDSSLTEPQRVELHDLEVLVLMGAGNYPSPVINIIAPNLLYLAQSCWKPQQSGDLWRFPKLIELDTTLELAYDLVKNHLSSLRTLLALPATAGLIHQAADGIEAPALGVLRVAVNQMGESLWDGVLRVLEMRPNVRIESEPGSWEQAVSLVPVIYRPRLQAVAERWVEVRVLSIADRFFNS